ncbi:MAG: hypothetical protein RBT76_04535 [candidate division Zixibacteria bacterium]|jgi:hypothetical protein|nr:hypothetical protein [candidate division Zixibacteria bacterium]
MRILLAITGALLLLFAAGSLTAAPRLEIPENTFNFGYVPQNATISHDFWLYSTGDDTLRILRIVPG